MITGKKGLTIKKKTLPGITASVYEDFVFAHQASVGETQITFSSLIVPTEMVSNGFTNPETTTILNRKISNKSSNVEVVSSVNGLLIQNMTYKVYDSYIKFVNYTSVANEVFVITVRSSASSDWTPTQVIRKRLAAQYSTNQTVNDDIDIYLMNATSGNLTVTLPTNSAGREIDIKKIDSSANTVTIDGNGSETIDGNSGIVISSQHNSLTMVSDGSNWFII